MADRPNRALDPPALAWVLGGLGAALLALPVVALAWRGGVAELPAALGSPAVRTALWLTAWTSLIATVVAIAIGVPLALLAERGPRRVGSLAATIGEAPLVIPPVVLGLGLLLTFGRDGMLGAVVDAAGLRITFSSTAVVLAQTVVAVPLVVLAVRAGLAALDPAAELAAAAHGAGPWRRTRLATLPALRGAILLGAALAWGRAAGEFGATLTFAGSLPGTTRTLPLAVFDELQTSPRLAAAAALLQVVVAVAALAVARRLRQEART